MRDHNKLRAFESQVEYLRFLVIAFGLLKELHFNSHKSTDWVVFVKKK